MAQLVSLDAISPSEVSIIMQGKADTHNAAAESIHNCCNYPSDVICGHVQHIRKRGWNWIKNRGMSDRETSPPQLSNKS